LKEVIIGDVRLIHGNSIDILPTLGECADLIVTDPPYKLSSGGAAPPGSIAEWHLAEDYNNDGSLVTCDIDWPDFMPLLYGAMRGDSHCYTMCNNRHVQGMLNAAEAAGLRFHNLCVWDKGACTPNRWYMKGCEFTGFFFKGKAKHINDCGAQQLVYCPNENYGGHPTVKSVQLMKFYIENSSKDGETVLDPFCGVGSTLMAAAMSGRKAIGIELEKKWFDLAVRRVSDFYDKPRQISMF
jgi:site-specific DNA-methyltransferase (adenine-specific)